MGKKVKSSTVNLGWLGPWEWREDIETFARPYKALVSNGKYASEIELYAYRTVLEEAG